MRLHDCSMGAPRCNRNFKKFELTCNSPRKKKNNTAQDKHTARPITATEQPTGYLPTAHHQTQQTTNNAEVIRHANYTRVANNNDNKHIPQTHQCAFQRATLSHNAATDDANKTPTQSQSTSRATSNNAIASPSAEAKRQRANARSTTRKARRNPAEG